MESQIEQQQLPFQRRDEFDQELYLRPLSVNAQRFLQVMYRAANGTPDSGCDGGIVKGTKYFLIAEQIVLADLIGISADLKKDSRQKAVRRTVEELEQLGVLRRKSFTDEEDGRSVQKLAYVLCLVALIDLPAIDLNTTRGRAFAAILEDDPFDHSFDEKSTPSEPLSDGLSGPVSDGLSDGPSGHLSGPHGLGHGLGPVNQTNKTPPVTHGHGEDQGDSEICFSESVWRDLTDAGVRALAEKPDLRQLKEMNRVGIDQWKWSDDPVFFQKFVAMVLHCGRTKGIKSPVGSLKSLMRKRDWKKIPAWAETEAIRFLKQHKPPPAPIVLNRFGGLPPREQQASQAEQLRLLEAYIETSE